MNILEKNRVDKEYNEAIKELRDLYDNLFYEELKGKIDDILLELQSTQHNLESETKKSTDTIKAYLTIIKEDLEKQINLKQRDALKEISQWLQHMNEFTIDRFDQQSNLFTENNKQVIEKLEFFIQSFGQWKDHLIKRLDDDLMLLEKHMENVINQVEDERKTITKDIKSNQEDFKSQLETLSSKLSLQLQLMEETSEKNKEFLNQKNESTKQELEHIIKQQIDEMVGQSKNRIETLGINLEGKIKFTRNLLYGIIGTQAAIIIFGIVALFT